MNYLLSYRVYIAPLGESLDVASTAPSYPFPPSQYLLPSKVVQDVTISHSTSIDYGAGITLGVTSPPTAMLLLIKNNLTQVTSRTYNWRMATVKIYYSIDSVNFYSAFNGFLETRGEELNGISYKACGFVRYLDYYKHYTPLWRNKAAATYVPDPPQPWSTAVSGQWGELYRSQDPTTLSGSYTGTVNSIFWLMGGRPYKYKEQAVRSAESVRFWYDCDHAPIVPNFTWLNQENVFDDLVSLSTATGGQITQTPEGVVEYINPHSFASAPKNITITDSMFRSLSVDEESINTYGKVVITFSARYLGANKAVLDDPVGKYLVYNEEYSHDVEFPQPVDRLTNNTYYGSGISFGASGGYFGIDEFIDSRDFVRAVDYTGETATVQLKIPRLTTLYFPKKRYTTASGWVTQQDVTKTPGQFMTLVIKNNDPARALYLAHITLFGIPVAAGEPQTIKVNIPLQFSGLVNAGIVPSGFREVRINENPYIQSKDQAMRLADVIKYLHKRPRPVIRVTDLIYNPALLLNDVITLSSLAYNLQGSYKIVDVTVKKTGAFMDIGLVDVSDIKQRNEFFIVGDAYESTDTKYLSW